MGLCQLIHWIDILYLLYIELYNFHDRFVLSTQMFCDYIYMHEYLLLCVMIVECITVQGLLL